MKKPNIRLISNISLEQVTEESSLQSTIDNIYHIMPLPSYEEEENLISDVPLSQIALHMDSRQNCTHWQEDKDGTIWGPDIDDKMWGLVKRHNGYAIACKCKNRGCVHFTACRSDLGE